MTKAQRPMVIDTFRENRRQGAAGYVDDRVAAAGGWGFDLAGVRVPTRVVVASEDDVVSVADGERLVDRLPGAQLTVVPGDHFGPREQAEMQLMCWVAGVA